MVKQHTRDGVRLAYQDVGRGELPLVFVHGWTCDHTYFAPQVEHFSRTQRVVAVDLRGHGASDKPEQPYTVEGLADDVAWLCAQVGLSSPVIVGHSMGGLVALALADRHADLPSAIVAIDSPWLPPGHLLEQVSGLATVFRSPRFREAQQQLVRDVLFLPTDDPLRRERIVEHMSSSPQHVMASTWEAVIGYQAGPALSALRVPALYVGGSLPLGTNGETMPFGSPAAIAACNPDVVIGQTVGAGHFSQLDAADQVNAMIRRFLAVSVAHG